MIEAGEDPRFIARRIIVLASEDIGMADPQALVIAIAAADAVQMIGMPEGRIPLAQAVVHLATAPKSNAAYMALDAAIADVRAGKIGRVPKHLRDAHYSGAKRLGHGKGYKYPHDDALGVLRTAVPARRTERNDLLRADRARQRARRLRAAGEAAPHRARTLTSALLLLIRLEVCPGCGCRVHVFDGTGPVAGRPWRQSLSLRACVFTRVCARIHYFREKPKGNRVFTFPQQDPRVAGPGHPAHPEGGALHGEAPLRSG